MIRLLRGQVVIRELKPDTGNIVAPSQFLDERSQRASYHRGEVLAMGMPAMAPNGAEVEYGFQVGDVVAFHWEHHEASNTREWPVDGKTACWVPWYCVDAVYE